MKDNKVKTLLSGPDKDWSSSLDAIIKQITTPYVFLWLDDIFSIRTINTARFSEALDFLVENNASHMHVEPKPAPDLVIKGKYGVYEKGAPYRAVTLGFWKVSTLRSLLIAGESPWNFEIMGSYRTAYADGYYCSMKNLIPRIHVVEKGSIFREAYDYCVRHGIPLDRSKRTVLASGSLLKSEMQKFYFNIVIHIPWKIRLSVMNILRKLLISY